MIVLFARKEWSLRIYLLCRKWCHN